MRRLTMVLRTPAYCILLPALCLVALCFAVITSAVPRTPELPNLRTSELPSVRASQLPNFREETITIRGRSQMLHIYGRPDGHPVLVSSGDGGWIHLGPHVAELLAANGYFVVGLDVKSYLSSFTSGTSALSVKDEPGDYLVLAQFSTRTSHRKPILIGVSEGAGLSVLAATDPRTKAEIAGVIGLGLPDLNELAWRARDMLIYLTHRPPNEPSFSAAAIVDKVAPLPLALIHSTRDEFVAVSEVERMLQAANDPKRLWVIDASNHRFENNLPEFDSRLLEAIGWVLRRTPNH